MTVVHRTHRVASYTFGAAAGSIDQRLLEWVVTASGHSSAVVVETSSNETHCSVTVSNQFVGSDHAVSQFGKGLVGCIRLLAAPELLLWTTTNHHHSNGKDAALVESWLQITEATLLPLLRSMYCSIL